MNAGPHSMAPDHGTGLTLALVGAILLLIGGLWSLDLFLARTEREAVKSEADALYRQGHQRLQEGRAAEAVDLLRQSNSMDRDIRAHQLEYVAALLAARKIGEANTTIRGVLEADPNDGQANLEASRIKVAENRINDARAYYHRAIYGVWPENPQAHRLEARLELVRWLAKRGEKEELLAELLPIEAEAQGNALILNEVARLFETAGSPTRAAAVYHQLIEKNPDEIEAYAGLGRVELAQGEYHSALAAFIDADGRSPGNQELQHDIELSKTLASIDPTPRHMSSSEKFARSTEILKLARDALNECLGGIRQGPPNSQEQMVEDVDAMLAQRPPTHVTNELAEARLALAAQLWQVRIKTCGASTADRELPLRRIMAKLSRS